MRIFRTKTFNFSILRGPRIVPRVVVTDYSAEQAAEFREQFRPLAEEYRQRLRRVGWILAGWIGFCGFLALDLPAGEKGFSVFCGFAGFLLIGGIFWPALPPCPACRQRLDDYVGAFCPECGNATVKPGGFLQPPKCSSCGKSLGSGRGGRQYKIRACTHCGVKLDEKGL